MDTHGFDTLVHPFKTCLIGRPGSGKTTIMHNLFLRIQLSTKPFQSLIIIQPSTSQTRKDALEQVAMPVAGLKRAHRYQRFRVKAHFFEECFRCHENLARLRSLQSLNLIQLQKARRHQRVRREGMIHGFGGQVPKERIVRVY